MVNRGKKFPYVALENPNRLSMILRDLTDQGSEAIERLMYPFAKPTRVRIVNEGTIKK